MSKIHEFRRQNIREDENADVDDQSLFDYSKDDISTKYHALKPETIFRF